MAEALDFYGGPFVLGEVVYFVEGKDGPGDELVTKRGSIDQLHGRQFPAILLHRPPYDKNTVRHSVELVSKNPYDLYRADEIVAAAQKIAPHENVAARRLQVDELVADPLSNREVTAAVQNLAVDRAATLLADVSAVAVQAMLRESAATPQQ
jgi:hypothetical protein